MPIHHAIWKVGPALVLLGVSHLASEFARRANTRHTSSANGAYPSQPGATP